MRTPARVVDLGRGRSTRWAGTGDLRSNSDTGPAAGSART
ncbi:hypothetical protein UO65_4242 [Actinokineospora spheciospongiae]|uniref:Uncharacterized protein n=1 Tax=Actinokineospora spheciospongiae TaxID=909613 RepID=W7IHU0_9PSEU|nr:hypothetical protein UO65_4242 [Actinokineospora spheciospongiae]